MKTTWIVDEYLLERSCPDHSPPLPDAIRAEGHDVVMGRWDRTSRKAVLDRPYEAAFTGPVLAYGSYPFVRSLLRSGIASRPGAFLKTDDLAFHSFAARHGSILFNSTFHILPFAEVVRRGYPGHDIFIRPDAVTKSFSGCVLTSSNFTFETSFLQHNMMVQPDELVVVAPAMPIELECRFIICDGKVIASSTYGWDDAVRPRSDVPDALAEIANLVAMADWQPDIAYACDIASGSGRTGLLELNAFSCSGLYACDTVAIAKAVSISAEDEHGLL